MTAATEVNPLELIDQGLSIFPCDAGDKRPVAKDPAQHPASNKPDEKIARLSWGSIATDDPAQIEKWIKDYPGCSWGVPTGSTNGFIAIDIDSPAAETWWAEKWLPSGKEVTSASGNLHVYYAVGQKYDIQTNRSKIHQDVDVRGEGGYVVAYTNDFRGIPAITEDILELLPERQEYTTEPAPEGLEPPSEVSEAERRVLKGITDMLDALPRPWRKGAGYHDVQFRAACFLNRIANSPYYATDRDYAHALFNQHAPLREGVGTTLRDQRWDGAVRATQGQIAEHPGDTPIRLDAIEILDGIKDQAIHTLFWESKKIGDVKRLIHELRMQGASEQEAYSVSYECAAMKNIRKANSGSSSTWGYVVKEYEQPIVEKDDPVGESWGGSIKKGDGYPLRLITEDERASVRNYPNFIDQYISAAQKIYDEPNMPIHYVNAWSALSAAVGDKGKIYLDRGVVPLNMWTLKMAPSAAGKSDANKFHSDVVDVARPSGWGDVYLGSDASAESLVDILMERNQRTSMIARDEAHSFLEASRHPGAYEYKTRQLFLELYDGNVSRAVRKGMDRDRVGERAWTNFILSLQGTWAKVTEAMSEGDIESGFIGRFLVAVGDEARITRDSLTLKFASEYQVSENGGRNPVIDQFADPVRRLTTDLGRGSMIVPASEEVNDRLTDIRIALRDFAETHPLADHLRGVLLRVGMNIAKGAALVALSEGRTRFEMEDLLLAAKSGEHWLKSSILLAEAVSSSEYRRLVEYVAEQVAIRPRSEGTLMKLGRLKNMRMFEAAEIIQRAQKEGLIEFDPASKKYREVEES